MKESDMFDGVKNWLIDKIGCEEVYGEVEDIDVVGFCGNLDIAIELKTTFSIKLLEQAIERSWRANYVYICMPYDAAKKCNYSRVVDCLVDRYGFGILSYDDRYKPRIDVLREAKLRRIKHYRRLRKCILPHHKLTVGGTASKESVTPYKVTIDNIKHYLRRCTSNGEWVTVDDILNNVETHYANPKGSTMATLRASWNEPWVESKLEKGKKFFRYRKEVTK